MKLKNGWQGGIACGRMLAWCVCGSGFDHTTKQWRKTIAGYRSLVALLNKSRGGDCFRLSQHQRPNSNMHDSTVCMEVLDAIKNVLNIIVFVYVPMTYVEAFLGLILAFHF